MNHLIDITLCLFTSVTAACFVLFFDFCIGEPSYDESGDPIYIPGRIFSSVGKWLILKDHAFTKQNKGLSVYKALGVCPVCFGVYVSLLFFATAYAIYGISAWYMLPTCVITSRLIRFWM